MGNKTNTIYAGLFNYAAQQLGGNYAGYSWKDGGEFGKLEDGELTRNATPVTLTTATADIGKIMTKAGQLQKSVLVFSPSPAIPQTRVYTRSTPFSATIDALPSADELYSDFAQYVKLPARSCQEGEMAKKFMVDLRLLGFQVSQDNAHLRIRCDGAFTGASEIAAETGNVIAVLKGDPHLPSFHLSVHLDGTDPLLTPVPHKRQGDIVKATGESVLRADDVSGIVIILKVVAYLQKHHIPHGDIHVTGLVAEESGAFGAKELGLQDMGGDIGLVFDGYMTDEVTNGGADIYTWNLKVRGRTEHVSHAPAVVNAGAVATSIISGAWQVNEKSLYHGDARTITAVTSGSFGSSKATTSLKDGKNVTVETVEPGNRVPNLAIIFGQVRTKVPNSQSQVIDRMAKEVVVACAKQGAICEFSAKLALPGFLNQSAAIQSLTEEGYAAAGLPKPKFDASFGGSNVNFIIPKRGNMLLMGIGVTQMHTTNEQLDLSDMQRAVAISVGMFVKAAGYKRVTQ